MAGEPSRIRMGEGSHTGKKTTERSPKSIFGALGIVADVLSVAELQFSDIRLLVLATSLGAVVFGCYHAWKHWSKPFGGAITIAMAIIAAGVGVFVFASAGTHRSVITASLAVPVSLTAPVLSTTTLTVPRPTTGSAETPATTTDSTAQPQTTTADPTAAIYYSGSVELEYFSADESVLLDDGNQNLAEGQGDLVMDQESVDAINRAVVAEIVTPPGTDPTFAECSKIKESAWHSSISVDELNKQAQYCVRTSTKKLGFMVFENVGQSDFGGYFYANLHWVVWKAVQ